MQTDDKSPPSDGATQPIDLDVLEELQALEAAGHFSVSEFLSLFFADTPARIAALHRAIDARDGAAVHLEAHTLKGSSREFGAHAMTAICQKLELCGKDAVFDEALKGIRNLEEEYDCIKTALTQWHDALPPQAK